MNILRLLTLALAFCLLAPVHIARAQDLEGIISSRVLPGWQLADGRRVSALELTLAKGWKTYWRAPGDAGIPPQFDWSRSRNLAAVQITWPQPLVFHDAGMRSIGYKNRVIIPLHLSAKNPNKPVRLKGKLDLGICADICMPHQLKFEATLDGTQRSPNPQIAAAMASAPFSATEAGVRKTTCKITPTEKGLQIEARITLPSTGKREETVIEAGNDQVWVSTPKTRRSGPTLIAIADMVHTQGGAFSLIRSQIRFTVIGSGHAVDILGCAAS